MDEQKMKHKNIARRKTSYNSEHKKTW